jgi:hypothetical protein
MFVLLVVSDNLMPLISQILLDAVIDPEYLYLPRKLLVFQSNSKEGNRPVNFDPREAAPHLRLIHDIMSDGTISLQDVSIFLGILFFVNFFFLPVRLPELVFVGFSGDTDLISFMWIVYRYYEDSLRHFCDYLPNGS